MNTLNRFQGCLLGLAVGDAVGTTVEFKPRGSFKPVTDMVGGGPFNLEPGQWTDDTSMALCLADSLIECRDFDPVDQMQRYLRWWREGYNSSTGRCFDIGNTVSAALTRFERDPQEGPYAGSTDQYSAGNGCLMRLAPAVMAAPNSMLATDWAVLSAMTTHGAEQCRNASALFGRMLFKALMGGQGRVVVLTSDKRTVMTAYPWGNDERLVSIARADYMTKTADQIRGSGYVVDSLEAALWSFATTTTFEDAILTAVNLGDDADTTAAICGQIAGAYYGADAIPVHWLATLHDAPAIAQRAIALHELSGRVTEVGHG